MRAGAACFALAAALFLTPAAAQKATEAESHVTSAFTSGADHGILAQNVALGPVLRRELGGETDSRRIYNLLIARTAGKAPSVTLLAPGEAASHAALPGVNAGEPMFRLAADGVVLLLQYATSQKNVTFVEQLGGSTPRSEASAPAAEASKPEVELPKPQAQEPAPVTSIPLPTEAPAFVPPAAVVAPAPIIEKPLVRKPTPAPVAVQKAPPPAPAPRGECVIKPVMTDDDMRNCAAVSTSRSTTAIEKPAVLVEPTAAGAAATTVPVPRPRPDCVIKPVMTDEELRICAAASTPRTRSAETVAPAVAVQTSAPSAAAPKPKPECVIKPVMTDEELRTCAAVSTARSPVVATPAAQRTAAPTPPAAEAPKPRPQCVIKAVMSDEDLRACR